MTIEQRFYETLMKTQRFPPEAMWAYQRGLIEKLVRHAREQVPFYRDSRRLDPLFDANDAIDWRRWNDIPILKRDEVQQARDAIFAEQWPSELGEAMDSFSSGSTGRPINVRSTNLERRARIALSWRAAWWHGHERKAPTMMIRNSLPKWQQTGAIERIRDGLWNAPNDGRIYLELNRSPEEQVGAIREFRPPWIITYASHAAILADASDREFECVEVLFVTGDTLDEDTRARITRKFHGTLIDTYAMTETGPVAHSAPGGGYYVADEMMLFERVEFDSRERFHEPVVTPLYGYSMPLIRYQSGDLVSMPSAGAAHSDVRLTRIDAIRGRVRSAFTLPDGSCTMVTVNCSRLIHIVDIEQFALLQDRRDHATIKIVARGAVPADAAERIRAILEPDFFGQLKLDVDFVDTLPRAGPKHGSLIVSLVS